jgi:hypothetical protein
VRVLVFSSHFPCHGGTVVLTDVGIGMTARRRCRTCKKRWLIRVQQSEVPVAGCDLRRALWEEVP